MIAFTSLLSLSSPLDWKIMPVPSVTITSELTLREMPNAEPLPLPTALSIDIAPCTVALADFVSTPSYEYRNATVLFMPKSFTYHN